MPWVISLLEYGIFTHYSEPILEDKLDLELLVHQLSAQLANVWVQPTLIGKIKSKQNGDHHLQKIGGGVEAEGQANFNMHEHQSCSILLTKPPLQRFRAWDVALRHFRMHKDGTIRMIDFLHSSISSTKASLQAGEHELDLLMRIWAQFAEWLKEILTLTSIRLVIAMIA